MVSLTGGGCVCTNVKRIGKARQDKNNPALVTRDNQSVDYPVPPSFGTVGEVFLRDCNRRDQARLIVFFVFFFSPFNVPKDKNKAQFPTRG